MAHTNKRQQHRWGRHKNRCSFRFIFFFSGYNIKKSVELATDDAGGILSAYRIYIFVCNLLYCIYCTVVSMATSYFVNTQNNMKGSTFIFWDFFWVLDNQSHVYTCKKRVFPFFFCRACPAAGNNIIDTRANIYIYIYRWNKRYNTHSTQQRESMEYIERRRRERCACVLL
jgi:hypothetical protein